MEIGIGEASRVLQASSVYQPISVPGMSGSNNGNDRLEGSKWHREMSGRM